MKNLIIVSLVFLLFLSCSKSKEEISNPFLGKWQLTAEKISAGGPTPDWTTISNGYFITFAAENTFTSTQITGCGSGTYTIINNRLTLSYACNNQTIPSKFDIVFNSNLELILKNMNCIEECSAKFQKIN